MNAAALIIAVIGLVLAAVSLVWQAATFQLSGPRVKVTIREGLRGPLGVMLAPPSTYTPAGRETLTNQGYTEHVLAVEAVNGGRLPATVNGWAIRFGNGAAYSNPTDPRNPTLPFRLESHSSAIWYAEVAHLIALQEAFNDQSDAAALTHGEVDLGNRRTVASVNALVLGSGGFDVPTPPLAARAVTRLRRLWPSRSR